MLSKLIPDSVKLPAAALLGASIAAGVLVLIAEIWWLPAARNEGRAAERSAALQRSIDLIKERGVTNDAISRLSDSDLCRKLGGKWVRDTGSCE
ncbi:hypothetical protein [Rhizobium sp. S96]|uniref:hypothetical protein n=1 Tax=Rhizobium sp. S96 TaxID=3055140 RepID=UPI0025AB16FC|nr:hypothetical protein [Rhizobium sp. S96]MDM9619069.1 hypothetical protein [Rhizobium sp. S96]